MKEERQKKTQQRQRMILKVLHVIFVQKAKDFGGQLLLTRGDDATACLTVDDFGEQRILLLLGGASRGITIVEGHGSSMMMVVMMMVLLRRRMIM